MTDEPLPPETRDQPRIDPVDEELAALAEFLSSEPVSLEGLKSFSTERMRDLLGMINRVRQEEQRLDSAEEAEHSSSDDPEWASKATIAPGPGTDDPNQFQENIRDLLRPQQIDNYEIVEEIARGGMGVVFRARQIKLDRTVALKMMLTGPFASEEEKQRFRIEAEAAAQLHHPGIVPVYSVGEWQGQPYFTMGFVDGETLSAQIQREPIDPLAAARQTLDIAKAVAYAHQQGVVHRDIKPSNVLLDGKNPLLSDFGLARRTAADSELTGTGQVLGTPSYMSPEQAAGRTAADGRLSDLYSVGATLYCMLTGKPPFQASGVVETLKLVIEAEPVPPHQINTNIPLDLSTICMKCLQKEPSRRYSSAQDLADDLQRLLNHEPITARPVGHVERFLKWSKRHPAIAVLSTAILISLLAILILGAWYQSQLSTALDDATVARADSVDRLYEMLTNEAEYLNRERPAGYGPRVWELVKQAKALETPLSSDYQLRQLAVNSMGYIGARESIPITDLGAIATSMEISADGSELYVGLESGEMVFVNLIEGDISQRIQTHGKPIARLQLLNRDRIQAIGPYQREVAVLSRSDSGNWEIVSHETFDLGDDFLALARSPDGRHFVGVSGLQASELNDVSWWPRTSSEHRIESDVRLPASVSRSNVNLTIVRTRPSGTFERFSIDQPGSLRIDVCDSRLAVLCSSFLDGSQDTTVTVFDLESGKQEYIFRPELGRPNTVVISPDGRYVACGGAAGAEIFDCETGGLLYSYYNSETCTVGRFIGNDGDLIIRNGVETVQFSRRLQQPLVRIPKPSSGWIELAESGSHAVVLGKKSVNVMPLFGNESVTTRGYQRSARSVRFSPDGRLLLTWGDVYLAKMWDAHSLDLIYSFRGSLPVFSSDGQYIAAWSSGEIEFWETSTGKQVGRIPCAFAPNSIKFSNDGKYLATTGWKYGEIRIWSLVAEDNQLIAAPHAENLTGQWEVAFSPSSRRLAYRSGEKHVGLIQLDRPDEVTILEVGTPVNHGSMVFLDDNNMLLAARKLQLWDTMSKQLVRESDSKARPPIAISPDQKAVICGGKLLRIADFSEIVELPTDSEKTLSIDWSPTGDAIAFTFDGGRISTWRLLELESSLQRLGLNFIDTQQDVPPNHQLKRLAQICRQARVDERQSWDARYAETERIVNLVEKRSIPELIDHVRFLGQMIRSDEQRPFMKTSSNGDVFSDRLGKLFKLSQRLKAHELYLVDEALLESVRPALLDLEGLPSSTIRKIALIHHASGDLHQFWLINESNCLDSYALESEILSKVKSSPDVNIDPTNLATDFFWHHRNYAMACKSFGSLQLAIKQMERAITIANENELLNVNPKVIEAAKKYLEVWNTKHKQESAQPK